MIYNVNEILACLAVKHQGDWDSIFRSLVSRQFDDLDCYYEKLQQMECGYVSISDERYPKELQQVYKPPFVLFYYGDINLLSNINKNIAVVGSRTCTEYGINTTHEIVKDVAKEFTVVSGMALGIDTEAQKTAIESGGRTIAVLGCGIDIVYPAANRELYNEIKKNHLIISELPGIACSRPESFPFRNRIIAGISKGTLVTEAYSKSGTLITIMYTLELNRTLMCVPYPIGMNSECNRLISDGAYLVENGMEVIDLLKT